MEKNWKTPSNWITNNCYVKPNVRFGYNGRRWAPALFDTDSSKKVYKMSRQVGKSTGGAAETLCYQGTKDSFVEMYISPTFDQTKKYSNDKLKAMCDASPRLEKLKAYPNNILERGFSRGGKVYLKYAKNDADACRGITCDRIHYDEVQDINLEAVVPVTKESMFTSNFAYSLFTGTPKSFANGMEKSWKSSDQREWLVRCNHHTPVKFINLGTRNIGAHGPICHECGNSLDVDDGIWVKHNPKSKIAGFHVHQLHCKISHSKQSKWDEILDGYKNYSRPIFLNEVLGLSADSAENPITETMLQSLCMDDLSMTGYLDKVFERSRTFMGIDWSSGTGAATGIVIGSFLRDVFVFMHFEKLRGKDCDPKNMIPYIASLVTRFRVERVHCDHGFGFGLNSQLKNELNSIGYYDIVTSNYWSDSANAKDAVWVEGNNGVPRLTLNKNAALSNFNVKMSNKKIAFPNWSQFEEYAEDFTNVRIEERKNGSIKFEKIGPDDLYHAASYCNIIGMAAYNMD